VGARRGDEEPARNSWLDELIDQSVFTPIRQGSAVTETVWRLGQAVAAGLLRPGDRLPTEARLAGALGISPVTLRSALTILRQGGLLETRRGRDGGTFVSPTAQQQAQPLEQAAIASRRELRDLVDYRCVVEGGAAAMAAEYRTDEHLGELRAQVDIMDRAEEFGAWGTADTLFHLGIAGASGSGRLLAAITEVRLQTVGISKLYHPISLETMRHSNSQHRQILKAIIAGSPERARKVAVRHIESTYHLWVGLNPALSPTAPVDDADGTAAPRRRAASKRRRADGAARSGGAAGPKSGGQRNA
jgi:DNA-binding FadR family transcriptional regulator